MAVNCAFPWVPVPPSFAVMPTDLNGEVNP